MKRRDLFKLAAVAGLPRAASGRSRREPAPDYMPIVADKMAGGSYNPCYEEREITEPVLLCDEEGRLNPAARGWARTPLFRANLKGHWPRKKKWNFWNWISPDFVFSITLADIDFVQFCAVSFIDFKDHSSVSGVSIHRSGHSPLPEEVEKSVSFSAGGLDYAMVNEGGDIKVDLSARSLEGKKVRADFVIEKPPGHETLNVVVPWSEDRFQLNPKHNTLGCRGRLLIGDKQYDMDPEVCHGVQDFGRGMWPYRSFWNWGVATGRQGRDLIGINVGAKWTTGTGANENGICLNGRLFKIMEDLDWSYDPNDWMKPWRVKSICSEVIDITLTPFHPHSMRLSLGVISTGGFCPFGHWSGVIRPGGQEIEVRNLIGWAEEFSHRW